MTKKKNIEIVSWNVNGIRAVQKKGFEDFLAETKPDIICLQETKAHPEQVDLNLKGYHDYWNSAEKKGYSGTAIFTKLEPLSTRNGMGKVKHDQEGRIITLEFNGCYLVTVYTPNAQRGLTRLDYRTEEWDRDFLKFIKGLDKKKPVVFCGDLNVAHTEIDLANPKSNKKNAGFTPEEREGFDRYMKAGFVDTFRHFNKDPGHYTWWSYRNNARERNIGWRIDYFCVSEMLQPLISKSSILKDIEGSDHCPIKLKISGDLFR